MTYFFDMLEPVDEEALDTDAAQYLVVVDLDGLYCVEAFYLAEQNERIQIVVGQYEFLKLREPLQLF